MPRPQKQLCGGCDGLTGVALVNGHFASSWELSHRRTVRGKVSVRQGSVWPVAWSCRVGAAQWGAGDRRFCPQTLVARGPAWGQARLSGCRRWRGQRPVLVSGGSSEVPRAPRGQGGHCGADAGTARVQDIGWGVGDNESHTLGCSWLGTLRSPRALTSPAHTRVLPPTSTRQGPRPSPDGVSSPGWNPVPHLCSFLMPCELLV